jgi:hypothetical protein
MRRVDINVPAEIGCDVTGFLYDSPLHQQLSEDMLEVCLDNGFLIDAGWYPHGDARGSYMISVSRGLELIISRNTKDVSEAAQIVEELISAYGRPWRQYVHSATTPLGWVRV